MNIEENEKETIRPENELSTEEMSGAAGGKNPHKGGLNFREKNENKKHVPQLMNKIDALENHVIKNFGSIISGWWNNLTKGDD